MEIIIKPAAREELKKVDFNEGKGIRVEAVFIGSCSIYAEYSLKIDKKNEDDDLFEVDGVPVLVSNESQKHLYNRILLDYNPGMGFKLSSDEEVYRYNLKLERVSM
ncbi:iron-sulfur cluster biosynthesis family protein [Neobacillus piezotolerans]|uniref:Iron-sulfur cluster biosynthesis family protein n=1 Tax=Neobacillus piezotolerans TaxID=2259171 RepID=A0A3D8GWS8_9BACI|nr:iron-sulfur cluster biosynthesis family protein [Neobacillus piezotolerans]RDU38631.1 iron-sulfur cluster biosynthesis family protein [Neobacillus piezotolerans]